MTQVLDLDATFDRDTVKVGGKEYELRNQEEFSILQWHQIVGLETQAASLRKDAVKSEAAATKLSQLQRDVVDKIVVDLDQEIADWQCSRILEFWASQIEAAAGKGGDGDPPRRSRSTGAGSSRGSKRSTAATRKPGSTSRAGR